MLATLREFGSCSNSSNSVVWASRRSYLVGKSCGSRAGQGVHPIDVICSDYYTPRAILVRKTLIF